MSRLTPRGDDLDRSPGDNIRIGQRRGRDDKSDIAAAVAGVAVEVAGSGVLILLGLAVAILMGR